MQQDHCSADSRSPKALVTGNAMEIRTLSPNFSESPSARRWPMYLRCAYHHQISTMPSLRIIVRRMTGVSSFYSHGCFHKKICPDYWEYNQVGSAQWSASTVLMATLQVIPEVRALMLRMFPDQLNSTSQFIAQIDGVNDLLSQVESILYIDQY